MGLTGRSAIDKIQDQQLKNSFGQNAQVLAAVLQQMKAAKVELRVLLFQGVLIDARECAKQFPDFDVILFISLFSSFLFVMANVLIDVAYAFIDPRVRVDQARG